MSCRTLILAACASSCSFVIDLPDLTDPVESDPIYNATTEDGQGNPRLAFFGNGSWLMVFEDDSGTPPDDPSGGVRARHFDPGGNPTGGDFIVHQNTVGEQEHAAIASTSEVAVMVWDDDSFAPPDTDTAVRARAFGSNGAALGADFLVASNPAGAQTYPAIAASGEGRFLVVWLDGATSVLRGRILNTDGTPFSSELDLAGPVTPNIPAAVGGSATAFVVVWSELDASNQSDIRARFVGRDGALDEPFVVNSTLPGSQQQPAVGFDSASGRFLAAWTDGSAAHDGDKNGIRGRTFDEQGSFVGPDFPVNDETRGDQERPTVAASGDGLFLIAWTGIDDTGTGIKAKRIGEDGAALGEEMLINRITLGDQKDPCVAASPNGFFQILWEDESAVPPDESDDSVRGRALPFR